MREDIYVTQRIRNRAKTICAKKSLFQKHGKTICAKNALFKITGRVNNFAKKTLRDAVVIF